MADQEGDFASYASARWKPFVRAAIVLGADAEEAQDVAQAALLRCYRSWRKVCKADQRDAYTYRILLNCFRDSRRRRWWGERPTDQLPESAVSDATGHVDLVDSVHRALADLTSTQREVVMLRYFAHLSEQETAELLRVPLGTVKSRLSRALATLSTSRHLSDFPEGLNS